MNTALMVLVLTALLALVLRRLEANHARIAATPWAAPLGATQGLDRDADRVRADVAASAAHASSGPRLVRPGRRVHPRRPVGAPRAA